MSDSLKEKILIPGGNGYLGRFLIQYFLQKDKKVSVLTRTVRKNLPSSVHQVVWDGKKMGPWAEEIDGAKAIINLTGRSVNCRYNKRNRQEIYRSRIDSTKILGEAISQSTNPPSIWINASSATIYRHAEDRPMDEHTGELGNGFSVDVCQQWEKAFFAAQTPNTRKVAARTAIVLGPGKGSALNYFTYLTHSRLGGKMGKGTQMVSWIHYLDFCRAIDWILEHKKSEGAINISSPHPLTNKEFMRSLREQCHVRLGLPSTVWMLKLGAFFLRTEIELLVKSRWVLPKKLLGAGYHFHYPTIHRALHNLLHQHDY